MRVGLAKEEFKMREIAVAKCKVWRRRIRAMMLSRRRFKFEGDWKIYKKQTFEESPPMIGYVLTTYLYRFGFGRRIISSTG